METHAQQQNESAKKRHIARSIFWAHVRRIGFPRTLIGGFLQYVSFLEFVFLQLSVIVILYRLFLVPFFKVKKFRMRDYVLLDRGRIETMCLFDKINCQFCAYANGTTKLWNDEIDELARSDFGKGKFLRKIVAAVYALCLCVFLVFSFIMSKILYVIIALFLGMHIADMGAMARELKAANYAGSHGPALRGLLRAAKLYAKSLATNLEQIESSWCPLKHLERENAVTAEHHVNFYDREKLDEVVEILATVGTVSPKKPKY